MSFPLVREASNGVLAIAATIPSIAKPKEKWMLLRYSQLCLEPIEHINHLFAEIRDRPDSPKAAGYAREIYDMIVAETTLRRQTNKDDIVIPVKSSSPRSPRSVSIILDHGLHASEQKMKRNSAEPAPPVPNYTSKSAPPVASAKTTSPSHPAHKCRVATAPAAPPLVLPRGTDVRDMKLWPLVGIYTSKAELSRRIAVVKKLLKQAKDALEKYTRARRRAKIAAILKRTAGQTPPPVPLPPPPEELANILHALSESTPPPIPPPPTPEELAKILHALADPAPPVPPYVRKIRPHYRVVAPHLSQRPKKGVPAKKRQAVAALPPGAYEVTRLIPCQPKREKPVIGRKK